MEAVKKFQIVVIGAGAGGLVVAIGAARAGKKVLLIEGGQFGGDCTNFGCIPSKSLIASAKAAHAVRVAKELGVAAGSGTLDAKGALERVRAIREEIRSHEEPDALEKFGVATLSGWAEFTSSHTLRVGEEEVSGKQIVIATGSSPFIPPIPGLENSPYHTNETIFELKTLPKSLAVMGAGPIGCELAQAFSRLGTKVTVIESMRGLLPREEKEVGALLKERFQKEGIEVLLRCEANKITYEEGSFHICTMQGEEHRDFESDELLISTGRKPNVGRLQLEKAGVQFSEKGIPVDRYGRTNAPHIFAIGDVVGGPLFTHLAESHGRSVLTTLLLPFSLKKKLPTQPVPSCTYTDPEVASIGLSEEEAKKQCKTATYLLPFNQIDRAITEGKTEGFVKIVTKKWSSKILGATIVGPRAGEMLPEISLAMLENIPLRKLAHLIHPYPTYSGAIRNAADLWLKQTVLGAFKRKST